MRVSNQQMANRLLSQLALTQRRLLGAQERVATGRRIERPSDDPIGAARVMATRTELDRSQQYGRNISIALGELAATESALARLADVLARVSELAVQAANASVGGPERALIAEEVSVLITEAIDVGNASHAGHYIFAGQLTSTAPYSPDNPTTPTVVTYQGDTGRIDREVAEASRLSINITGNRMQPFAALITFRDNLLANDATAIGNDSAALEVQLDNAIALRAEIGASMQRAEAAASRLLDEEARLRTQLFEIEEVDLSQAIVELQMSETAYQAALGIAGRMFNLSILDFLR
ncbi:MAG: flagellar hook-associated protein FlgL [Dehalococcoidia bacterium]